MHREDALTPTAAPIDELTDTELEAISAGKEDMLNKVAVSAAGGSNRRVTGIQSLRGSSSGGRAS